MRGKRGARYVVYEDSGGGWRWKKLAGNNRTVASSGEAFSSQYAALTAAEREAGDLPVIIRHTVYYGC